MLRIHRFAIQSDVEMFVLFFTKVFLTAETAFLRLGRKEEKGPYKAKGLQALRAFRAL